MNFRDSKLKLECEYVNLKDWGNSFEKLEYKKYYEKLV